MICLQALITIFSYLSITEENRHYVICELFLSIMNFTFDLEILEKPDWGILIGNNTFTGLVGKLQRKEIDVSPIEFSITKSR